MWRIAVFLLSLLGVWGADSRQVSTIAGTGAAGFSGDGGIGTKGQINNPYGLVIGPDGALYFCEVDNHRIRQAGPEDAAVVHSCWHRP